MPIPGRLPDILEVFAGFETNRAPRRDAYFLACPWVTTDPTLSRLDLEDAESAELDTVSALHREAHSIKDGINGHLSFRFGDVGCFRDFVDDIDLDHGSVILS
jgi:hypothetical protein